MLLDPPEPVLIPVSTATISAGPEIAKTADDEPDSQNPQSLPSPPPEQYAAVDGEERVTTRQEHPAESSLRSQHTSVEPTRNKEPERDEHPPDDPREQIATARTQRQATAQSPAAKADCMAPPARKKLRRQLRRKDKKLKKLAAGSSAPNEDNREESADAEDDQYYWDNAERDIPDHLLVEDAGQQEGLAKHDSANEQSPQKEPKVEPASQLPRSEDADPWALLRSGCITERVSRNFVIIRARPNI